MDADGKSGTDAAAPAGAHPDPSLPDLFLAFATMSLSGFGGVLYWARRVLVERRRWMTAEEFNEAFALCHVLPGPNIVNLSVVFGARFRGIPGAVVAFVGLLGPPTAIVTVLAMLYGRFGGDDALQRTLHGISCAAIGLFIATLLKMMGPLARQRAFYAVPVIAAIFLAIGVARWPLPYVLLAAIPASLALTYVARRAGDA